jgi:transposase-like protein
MGKTRKSYSASFKAQVVQEAMSEEKSYGQIASEYGIHPTMITKWKQMALKAMPATFTDEGHAGERLTQLQAQHDRETHDLYAEIGRLTTQVNWLQKKITAGTPFQPGSTPAHRSRHA